MEHPTGGPQGPPVPLLPKVMPMDNHDNGLALTVTIPVGEWAFTRRRLTYLEAVILQILHDPDRIKEWFGAAELATLRLRGLPQTRQGVSRLAKAQGWRCRAVPGRGGLHQEFHCTALPEAAFTDLLGRMVAPEPHRAAQQGARPSLNPPMPHPPPPLPANTAPPWVLPLVRCLRGDRSLTLREAVEELSVTLPPGMACPSHNEAEVTLRRFGYLV